MEYLIFILAMVAVLAFIVIQGKLSQRRELNYRIRKLKELNGAPPNKEYKIERFLRIPGYYEKHKEDFQIDDITWNDLGMDDIFVRMNYAMSSTGEEYLYYMLRTPQFEDKKLTHLDEVAEYYREHNDARVQYQCLMQKLGSTGKYSLYDYLDYLYKLGERSNQKDILMLIVFVGIIGIMYVYLSFGIVAMLIWMFYQILSYFKIKKENEPYLTSLAYVMRLIDISEKVTKVLPEVCEEEKAQILKAKTNLRKSKRGSFWIFGSVYKTGSPLDAVFDYIRMIFHVDLIFFNNMLGEIVQHTEDVDILITNLGWLESAISVGLFRESLHDGWSIPKLGACEMNVINGYHPLISAPVKNSIRTSRSVLLTGSNASGKSTFLKMMALNSLMAQTIYTVAAEKYESPYFYLYSSMSLRDDLDSGESYYIVEIKSIKRIIDMQSRTNGKILCFVDEVLRGTNTIERIAASTQILMSMVGEDIQCFAATHDIEMTHLLSDVYENYHFEEEIKDGDVLFNYQLQEGRATTRNAIKLLEIMGYKPEIIKKAQEQADIFLKQGIWKRP